MTGRPVCKPNKICLFSANGCTEERRIEWVVSSHVSILPRDRDRHHDETPFHSPTQSFSQTSVSIAAETKWQRFVRKPANRVIRLTTSCRQCPAGKGLAVIRVAVPIAADLFTFNTHARSGKIGLHRPIWCLLASIRTACARSFNHSRSFKFQRWQFLESLVVSWTRPRRTTAYILSLRTCIGFSPSVPRAVPF